MRSNEKALVALAERINAGHRAYLATTRKALDPTSEPQVRDHLGRDLAFRLSELQAHEQTWPRAVPTSRVA